MSVFSVINNQVKKVAKYIILRHQGYDLDYVSQVKFKRLKVETPCENVFIKNSRLQSADFDIGCKFSHVDIYGAVNIGRFVSIFGPGTVISQISSQITIGSFSSIGQNVVIQDSSHRLDKISTYFMNRNIFGGNISEDVFSKGPVILGEDVWVGSNVVILPNVTIGRGAVIGAGSIVTKNVPKYAIAVGNPARVVGHRFTVDVIDTIEESKWWTWPVSKIIQNKELFMETTSIDTFDSIGR
jgi:virginiamycin A acetyltransferase